MAIDGNRTATVQCGYLIHNDYTITSWRLCSNYRLWKCDLFRSDITATVLSMFKNLCDLGELGDLYCDLPRCHCIPTALFGIPRQPDQFSDDCNVTVRSPSLCNEGITDIAHAAK